MPTKKEKSEKASVETGSVLVLEYLKQQNRPYSAIEISANLHNKVTKAQAVKILKDLSETQQIACKISGKQSVYHVIQDPQDNLTPDELKELDVVIEELRVRVSQLKEEEKLLKLELVNLKATVTTPELRDQHESTASQMATLQSRYTDLASGNVNAVSVEEKLEIEKSTRLWSYKATARKKAFKNLWQTLTEILPEGRSATELWEELGLEAVDE